MAIERNRVAVRDMYSKSINSGCFFCRNTW